MASAELPFITPTETSGTSPSAEPQSPLITPPAGTTQKEDAVLSEPDWQPLDVDLTPEEVDIAAAAAAGTDAADTPAAAPQPETLEGRADAITQGGTGVETVVAVADEDIVELDTTTGERKLLTTSGPDFYNPGRRCSRSPSPCQYDPHYTAGH